MVIKAIRDKIPDIKSQIDVFDFDLNVGGHCFKHSDSVWVNK